MGDRRDEDKGMKDKKMEEISRRGRKRNDNRIDK
jgi:hypothetical protein